MHDWKELANQDLSKLIGMALVGFSTAFALAMGALVRVAPKLIDRLWPGKPPAGDASPEPGAEQSGPSRREFSDLFGRVGVLEVKTDRIDKTVEAQVRESQTQTEQLTKVRVDLERVAGDVRGTRDKLEDLCERTDENKRDLSKQITDVATSVRDLTNVLLAPRTQQ